MGWFGTSRCKKPEIYWFNQVNNGVWKLWWNYEDFVKDRLEAVVFERNEKQVEERKKESSREREKRKLEAEREREERKLGGNMNWEVWVSK